ncbi:MAG: class I SAM-dependent methyltransferase [Candidatus Hodarchaeota archaeon]
MKQKDDLCKVMKEFWNQKARKNAMYYVSTFRPYNEQDPEEFWKWGKILTERYLKESGIFFTGEEMVLDLGCGIGRMTKALAERFAEVYGLDVSEEMINQAHKNLKDYKNIKLEVGNGKDLSNFGDKMFDLIFSYLTFQHIPDVQITLQYIREAGRVLKNGGYFYFQANNSSLMSKLRSRLRLRYRIQALIVRMEQSIRKTPITTKVRSTVADRPKDLDNPAWTGSRVSIEQIMDACKKGQLHILNLKGRGTQYLWVKAVKLPQKDKQGNI